MSWQEARHQAITAGGTSGLPLPTVIHDERVKSTFSPPLAGGD